MMILWVVCLLCRPGGPLIVVTKGERSHGLDELSQTIPFPCPINSSQHFPVPPRGALMGLFGLEQDGRQYSLTIFGKRFR